METNYCLTTKELTGMLDDFRVAELNSDKPEQMALIERNFKLFSRKSSGLLSGVRRRIKNDDLSEELASRILGIASERLFQLDTMRDVYRLSFLNNPEFHPDQLAAINQYPGVVNNIKSMIENLGAE